MFVKLGVLEPAEAEAPATPLKRSSKRIYETGVNPLSQPLSLRNPHTERSEEFSF